MIATRAPKAAVAKVPLVTFRVGEQPYAADVHQVERVLPWETPRTIPNVPAWLDGVIEFRGRVVPVIDLRTRFELPAAPDRTRQRIVVFGVGTERIAAAVDAVDEVRAVEKPALEDPPELFRGLARQYLRALVRAGDEVIVVLDVAQLLNARERIVLDQAVAEAKHG